MGLDTTHGCWTGGYMGFGVWREELAKAAGFPPLALMEGYFAEHRMRPSVWTALDEWKGSLPIRWAVLAPDPLIVLLDHSDSDGWILVDDCAPLADRLEGLLDKLPQGPAPGHIVDWQEKTKTFIKGLRLAASLGEDVRFH